MMQAAEVRSPQELGLWQKIQINAIDKTVKCWCEKCNADARCFWVDTFHALQFGEFPNTKNQKMKDSTLGWSNMTKEAIEVIKFYLKEIKGL